MGLDSHIKGRGQDLGANSLHRELGIHMSAHILFRVLFFAGPGLDLTFM